METTCEFKLGNHRGDEGKFEVEQMMCAAELGLRHPSEWNREDWEKFNHWRNIFHSYDIISGPHSDEIYREREKLAEESEKWLKEHCR